MPPRKPRAKYHPITLFQDFVYRSRTFCCCLPVRFGVIVMSLLTLLLSGILMIVLWFEVSDNTEGLSTSEKTAFIAAALVETSLFIASVLGFSGAVVRKQSFVTIYGFFLYFHLGLNVIIAAYFLYAITHVENNAVVKVCQQTVKDSGAKKQCTGIFEVAVDVYAIVMTFLLLIEIYGTIIMARYLHQIKGEKHVSRVIRNSRLSMMKRASQGNSPSGTPHARFDSYGGQADGLPVLSKGKGPGHESEEFNPYRDYEQTPPPGATRDVENPPSPPPLLSIAPETEQGYGGGMLTHDRIISDEKARMRSELGVLSEDEEALDDVKSLHGPPAMMSTESEGLPMYTARMPSTSRHGH